MRKTFHANVRTENPIFELSVHYLLRRSTYFLNMLNFHVVFSLNTFVYEACNCTIFANFALDRDVDVPFLKEKYVPIFSVSIVV